jgi:hypothetical protein
MDLITFRLMILLILALFLFNVYIIHVHYTLSKKCDFIFLEISRMINSLGETSTKKCDIRDELDIKDIIISSDNIKPQPYSPSLSSLIEVSSNDGDSDDESNNEDIYDDESNYDNYLYDSSNIKNVHMTLDLDELELNKFENIHVLLLDNDTPTEHHENLENKPSTPVMIANEDISDLLVKTPNPSKKIETKLIDGDIKKMNLTDLKKYVSDNKLNINTSKMKKTEILKAIEDYKINQEKEEREREREREEREEREKEGEGQEGQEGENEIIANL